MGPHYQKNYKHKHYNIRTGGGELAYEKAGDACYLA